MNWKFLLLLLLGFGSASAQNTGGDNSGDEIQTLLGNRGGLSHGGYGALYVGYEKIGRADGVLAGVRGMWMIDHTFGLGFGGYGFATNPFTDDFLNGDCMYAGGYGGLVFEPVLFGRRAVHLSFPLFIGAGGVSYFNTEGGYWGFTRSEWGWGDEDHDAFFVVSPSVELEMNVVRFFRVAAVVGYRWTSKLGLNYRSSQQSIASSDLLNNWNFGLVFKFGRF